jgi:hypothetical protein
MTPGTSNNYFTATAPCTTTLTIFNNDTYAVLYTGAAPTTILHTVVLTRFLWPILRFQCTKPLVNAILHAQVFVDNVTHNYSYDTAGGACAMNTTT